MTRLVLDMIVEKRLLMKESARRFLKIRLKKRLQSLHPTIFLKITKEKLIINKDMDS